jgi:hypothetical protein
MVPIEAITTLHSQQGVFPKLQLPGPVNQLEKRRVAGKT